MCYQEKGPAWACYIWNHLSEPPISVSRSSTLTSPEYYLKWECIGGKSGNIQFLLRVCVCDVWRNHHHQTVIVIWLFSDSISGAFFLLLQINWTEKLQNSGPEAESDPKMKYTLSSKISKYALSSKNFNILNLRDFIKKNEFLAPRDTISKFKITENCKSQTASSRNFL